MEPARVRFLEEGEEPVLPKWTKLLPQRWRQRKTVDTYPYTLTRVDGVLTGILQAERTAVLTADWRRGASRLLAALEEAGILGGLPVEGGVLWCATEKVSKAELDRAAAIVKEVLAK